MFFINFIRRYSITLLEERVSNKKALFALTKTAITRPPMVRFTPFFFLLHFEQNFLKDGAIWNGLAIVFKFGPDTPS